MWELDYKAECQRVDAFELCCWRRLLRVPWTARRSIQSTLKEISPEYSLEELMLKTETSILWPPDAKNWLIRKDPDAGKDWRQEEKGMTEDEMVGWYHWLHGHEFGWTPGVGDGQGGLAFWGPWTEWLNWTERCSNPNLQNLLICYFIWQNGICRYDYVKDLKMGKLCWVIWVSLM